MKNFNFGDRVQAVLLRTNPPAWAEAIYIRQSKSGTHHVVSFDSDSPDRLVSDDEIIPSNNDD